MGYEVIVRNRGRRESVFLLVLAGFFGLIPVVTFLTTPKANVAALILGVGLGIPLLFLSFWRLFRMDALALSQDGNTLLLIKRRVKGTEKIHVATSDVAWIGLEGHELAIGRKSGATIELEVEVPLYAQPALTAFAARIGVPFSCGPSFD